MTPKAEKNRLFMETDGFTLLELIIVVAIVALLAAIALPAYNAFIQRAKETAVLSYLNNVKKAQETLRIEDAASLYADSFEDLETTGFVNDSTGAASRVEHGYQFTLAAGISSGEAFWNIIADPAYVNPKARHFYVDQTGVVRYAVGAPAGPGSPPIGH